MTQPGKRALFFDTSLSGVNVGLYDSVQAQTWEAHRDTLRGQAEHLIPMTKEITKQAGLKLADIDKIVTTIGPGSFTGLRLSLSAAKSYGLAMGKPVLGLSTLRALALSYAAFQKEKLNCHIAVVVETKRSDFYVQVFDEDVHAVTEPMSLTLDQAASQIAISSAVHVIGDGAARLHGQMGQAGLSYAPSVTWGEEGGQMNAGLIARYAIEAPDLFTGDLTPLYLRGADVSQPKAVQRKVSGV